MPAQRNQAEQNNLPAPGNQKKKNKKIAVKKINTIMIVVVIADTVLAVAALRQLPLACTY